SLTRFNPTTERQKRISLSGVSTMRVTISAPDPGCVEFATRALNAFIKGRGNGEFPNPSGAISNSFFGAECTEKPNGNYSIKCWRIPTNIAEAA
ncbi:TPA: hypothetical protein ACPZLC_004579, partial [Yersinia enterocolitica]